LSQVFGGSKKSDTGLKRFVDPASKRGIPVFAEMMPIRLAD
jgi:hypothetical protein